MWLQMAKDLTKSWSYYWLKSLKKERRVQKSSRSSGFPICSEDHGGASSGYQKLIAAFYIRFLAFENNFLQYWIQSFSFRAKDEIIWVVVSHSFAADWSGSYLSLLEAQWQEKLRQSTLWQPVIFIAIFVSFCHPKEANNIFSSASAAQNIHFDWRR